MSDASGRLVAVRPPEYLPRVAYMALVAAADRFVLADTFQYSRQSYQNRARLRSPQGWHWISVPLKGRQHGRPAAAVELDGREPWARKHWRAFEYNYHSTPYFPFYEPAFRPLYARPWTHLADLTCATVELLHGLLGLSTPLVRASALAGAPATLPAVRAACGADAVLAPAETAAYDAGLVPCRVLHFEEPAYRQNFEGFVPGLSAVDLLFNYGPDAPAVLRRGIRSVDPPSK